MDFKHAHEAVRPLAENLLILAGETQRVSIEYSSRHGVRITLSEGDHYVRTSLEVDRLLALTELQLVELAQALRLNLKLLLEGPPPGSGDEFAFPADWIGAELRVDHST